MNIVELISTVTKAEGKKKSVAIGDVREILAIQKRLCKEPQNLVALLEYLMKGK